MLKSDFFDRQDKARKLTSVALLVYCAFVVALGAAIHCVVAVAAAALSEADLGGGAGVLGGVF
jgi:hypothetical protein